jgi:nucleotide-binding universal stress UspA family protein
MKGFPGRILLATDGSEDAALAGRAAVDLAKITGARLHVMHAWQAEVRRAYEVTLPVSLREWCEQKAAELLAKEVKQIEEAGCEVAEAHLVMSRAGDAILDLSEELGPVLVITGRPWDEPWLRVAWYRGEVRPGRVQTRANVVPSSDPLRRMPEG